LEQLGMPIILGGMLALVLGLLPQIFLRRIEERGEHARVDGGYDARHSAVRRIDAEHAYADPRHSHHAGYVRGEARFSESAYRR
jgi:hypothetical protein